MKSVTLLKFLTGRRHEDTLLSFLSTASKCAGILMKTGITNGGRHNGIGNVVLHDFVVSFWLEETRIDLGRCQHQFACILMNLVLVRLKGLGQLVVLRGGDLAIASCEVFARARHGSALLAMGLQGSQTNSRAELNPFL